MCDWKSCLSDARRRHLFAWLVPLPHQCSLFCLMSCPRKFAGLFALGYACFDYWFKAWSLCFVTLFLSIEVRSMTLSLYDFLASACSPKAGSLSVESSPHRAFEDSTVIMLKAWAVASKSSLKPSASCCRSKHPQGSQSLVTAESVPSSFSLWIGLYNQLRCSSMEVGLV